MLLKTRAARPQTLLPGLGANVFATNQHLLDLLHGALISGLASEIGTGYHAVCVHMCQRESPKF